MLGFLILTIRPPLKILLCFTILWFFFKFVSVECQKRFSGSHSALPNEFGLKANFVPYQYDPYFFQLELDWEDYPYGMSLQISVLLDNASIAFTLWLLSTRVSCGHFTLDSRWFQFHCANRLRLQMYRRRGEFLKREREIIIVPIPIFATE